jgi:hypothetical protein
VEDSPINPLINFISCNTGSLWLLVRGNISEVAEVAEQLAWLGAAVRSSNIPGQSALCTPELTFMGKYDLYMKFPLSRLETPELGGTCWHGMFEGAVVVNGFPIPSRPGGGLGVEISLEITADLLQANSVADFKGRPLIKGFSTILYPVHYRNGIVSWHLIANSNGERISYADPRVGLGSEVEPNQLSHNDLGKARHVVGWCGNVDLLAGKSYSNSVIIIFFFYLIYYCPQTFMLNHVTSATNKAFARYCRRKPRYPALGVGHSLTRVGLRESQDIH